MPTKDSVSDSSSEEFTSVEPLNERSTPPGLSASASSLRLGVLTSVEPLRLEYVEELGREGGVGEEVPEVWTDGEDGADEEDWALVSDVLSFW